MKKAAIVIGILIAAGLTWWAVRPLFFDKVVNEPLPVPPSSTAPIGLNLSNKEFSDMDEETKLELEKQMVEQLKEIPDMTMDEPMPPESYKPAAVSSGQFMGRDGFHQGEGSATIYSQADGSYLLRFDDFSVTNGPDLRVYLTQAANPDKDQVAAGLEIQSLKGDKGSQNYLLPEGFDPAKYGSVVIYCKPFGVVFASANLSQ